MRIGDWSSDVCSSDLLSRRSTQRSWMRAEITSQSAMHSSALFNVLLRESGELGQPVRAQMISQGEQGLEPLARSNKMRLVEQVAGYSGQDNHWFGCQDNGWEKSDRRRGGKTW